MSENKQYNATEIETLSFLEAIRTRVAMYMGSADNMGVMQCVREIITNSIDEATMGFGNRIEIHLYPDNKMTIIDEGRGCPFGKRPDGTEALEAIYTMPHTGGKFNNKTYQNVAGMNGIGAKGVALSSKYFSVTSYRDKQFATLELVNGVKQKFETKPDLKNHHSGTSVTFIPSEEVYNLEPINIDFEAIKKMCKDWSYLSKGIAFELTNHITNEKVKYLSNNGLLDFMRDTADKAINKTPLHICVKEGDFETEIVMEWTNSRTEIAHVFTNGLENIEGGTSLTGIKTALTNFFKKKVKAGENADILRRGLFYAVHCKVPNPSFANQTKTKVNNLELRGLCQRATTQMLNDFELKHSEEFNRIVDMLAKEVRADAAAERARKQVLENAKEVESAGKQKFIDSDKLSDARTLGNNATLLLVEGKSAGGAMQRVRDVDKYGILKLRGKIINALSNDIEDVLKNEEVSLFLKATGINIHDYSKSKLRYGRVAICVDADDDGMHIACLIIALLYRLAPQYIRDGRLCWLHAPLYKRQKGKEIHVYYSDEEVAKATFKGEQTRFKGLGEMNDEDARPMFGPEQSLEQLVWSDAAAETIENLMGKDIEPRREFIFNNIDFERYGEV